MVRTMLISPEVTTSTWEGAAQIYTSSIWEYVGDREWQIPDVNAAIRVHLDTMIDAYFNKDGEPSHDEWTHLAALSILASGYLDETETLITLCNKQRDYGPNNIARFGSSGLLLRLHDKVARLENLLSHGHDARNESLNDTYLDIVGYSVIGHMLIEGSFFFPMADA